MTEMIKMLVDSVRVSLTSSQRIVVLHAPETDQYLPIWIGPFESEAITIALQEIEMSRPQTHDLMKNMLGQLNARVDHIEITGLREDVFFGSVILENEGQFLQLDSRPSDAIALAVRYNAPIFVHSEILVEAAIQPEPDLMEQIMAAPSPIENRLSQEDSDRLSVFKDFLSKIEPDAPDSSEPPEEPKPPAVEE